MSICARKHPVTRELISILNAYLNDELAYFNKDNYRKLESYPIEDWRRGKGKIGVCHISEQVNNRIKSCTTYVNEEKEQLIIIGDVGIISHLEYSLKDILGKRKGTKKILDSLSVWGGEQNTFYSDEKGIEINTFL